MQPTELSAAEVIDLSDTEDEEMTNAAPLQAPKTTQLLSHIQITAEFWI